MMNAKQKRGFSLAESIISMVILAIVILITFAGISRKKTVPLNKVTISGIYACWENDNGLQQKFYDGHRLVYGNNNFDNNKCKFEMDRRAYKYYIFAAGANNGCKLFGSRYECFDGQVTQRYIEAPSGADEDEMKLSFEIGKASGNGDTRVIQNGNYILEALGNITSDLTYRNLRRCKFLGCPDNNEKCKGKTGDNKVKTPCTGDEEPVCNVDVNGQSINIACVKDNEGSATDLTIQDHSCQIRNPKYNSDGGFYSGDCIQNNENETNMGNVRVSIEKIDSSIDNNHKTLDNAKIVKLLKMLPESIQNGLTDELLEYYQNDFKPKKNGAVLIIW